MKTATEYRAAAAASDASIIESRERCDTDGFVSTHCSGLSSRLSRVKADIVDAGGVSDFLGLFEGDRRVKARVITNTFDGYRVVRSWLMDESETALIEARGKKFLPTGAKSRILKGLGLVERWETAPAWATYGGSGTGFSGLSSVYIKTYRTGDKWGMDATLAEEDSPTKDPKKKYS
jgi:hypothetical protein